jgi:hypothetical protein
VNRTIRLRLIVPRDDSPESVEKRRAIWATHVRVNTLVRGYEGLLLEMRQRDLRRHDDVVPASFYQDALRRRLTERGCTRIDEAMAECRRLYERIVRSSVAPGEGQASDGAAYLRGLVLPAESTNAGAVRDARASAFAHLRDRIIAKLSPKEPIPWLEEARDVIDAGLASGAFRGGKPAPWMDTEAADDLGRPLWPERLRAYLIKAGEGPDPIIVLRGLGVLPLAPLDSMMLDADGRPGRGVTRWEQMAFSIAVGKLNAFESQRANLRKDHVKRAEDLERHEKRHAAVFSVLRPVMLEIEEARAIALREVGALWADDTAYRLTHREVRGWPSIARWLVANPGADGPARTARVTEELSAMVRSKRDPGAHEALCALAARWEDIRPAYTVDRIDDIDPIVAWARRNDLLGAYERAKPEPAYTEPTPLQHPCWAAFDPPKNSNQPRYELLQGERAGMLRLKLELLSPSADGGLRRKSFLFDLAPSGQTRMPSVQRVEGAKGRVRTVLTMNTQDGLGQVACECLGSTLSLDRVALTGLLEAGSAGDVTNRLAAGIFGRRLGALFNLAISIGDAETERRLRDNTAYLYWLASAAPNRGKKRKAKAGEGAERGPAGRPPPEGLRVMGAHLQGASASVAVSVFELRADAEGATIPVPATALHAHHERSALLRLPGDAPSAEARRIQERLFDWLASISASISHLGALRRVCLAGSSIERRARIEEMGGARVVVAAVRISEADLELLNGSVDASTEAWKEVSFAVYDRVKRGVGQAIHEWREWEKAQGQRRLRLWGVGPRKDAYIAQKARVLSRWETCQHPIHGVGAHRLALGERARHNRWLRRHRQHRKDGTMKTLADLVVQSARGVAWSADRGWAARYRPVDIIVADRRLPEAQKKILTEQAEIYGIAVAYTWSTRSLFTPGSQEPLVSVRALTAGDAALAAGGQALPGWLEDEMRDNGLSRAEMRTGRMILSRQSRSKRVGCAGTAGPAAGSRFFSRDIIAAQRLALGFVEAHNRVTQIRTREIGEDRYVSAEPLGETQRETFGAVKAEQTHVVFDREANASEPGYAPTATSAPVRESCGASARTGETAFKTLVRWDGRWHPADALWPARREELLRAMRAQQMEEGSTCPRSIGQGEEHG